MQLRREEVKKHNLCGYHGDKSRTASGLPGHLLAVLVFGT